MDFSCCFRKCLYFFSVSAIFKDGNLYPIAKFHKVKVLAEINRQALYYTSKFKLLVGPQIMLEVK